MRRSLEKNEQAKVESHGDEADFCWLLSVQATVGFGEGEQMSVLATLLLVPRCRRRTRISALPPL